MKTTEILELLVFLSCLRVCTVFVTVCGEWLWYSEEKMVRKNWTSQDFMILQRCLAKHNSVGRVLRIL